MSSRTRRVRTTTGIVAVLLLWAVASSLAIPDAAWSPVEPGASITAIGQAAVTGDRAVLEKYVDAEAVARAVYPMVVEQMKETPDYRALAGAVGEQEADRILREQALCEDAFVDGFREDLAFAATGDAGPLFSDCTVASSEISGDSAEVVLTGREGAADVRYVVDMRLETVDGERLWRVKGIADARGRAPARTGGR